MAKELYKASVTFDDKTIQRVFRAAYYTYDKLKVILRAVAGFILIAIAIFAGLPTAANVLLLLVGCWLFVALDFPSKVRAEGVIAQRRGMVNTIHIRFTDIGAEVVEERKRYRYEHVDRLVADKNYLFIFYNKQTALMIDTATLEPGGASEFRQFISGKTGKQWKTTSILFMNFKDLKQAVKDQFGKKG